jgi:hypothetical protein
MNSYFSISIKSGKLLMVQLQVTNTVSDSEAATTTKGAQSPGLVCLVMCHVVDQCVGIGGKKSWDVDKNARCAALFPRGREEKNIAFGWALLAGFDTFVLLSGCTRGPYHHQPLCR